MITQLFIIVVLGIINTVFSFLPIVNTLPTIGGYDLDTALVGGVAQFHTYIQAFWYIGDVFTGYLILLVYFGAKMLLKLLLGSRAPGRH